MNNDRLERLQALFCNALEIPADQRADWISKKCGDDLQLAEEIRALIAQDQRTNDPFEQGLANVDLDLLAIADTEKCSSADPTPRTPRSDSTTDTDSAAQQSGQEFPRNEASTRRPFGDYEILDKIAEGGMGVVYKARQTTLNRVVALKMIRSHGLANDEQVERFRSEAQAAAKLDHPGIVPVYEVGQHDGQHFFSMAYVDGASLHERVKSNGPLPPKEAAEIVKTMAIAVQVGHDRKIIHRDIKPQNILIDSTGNPRITDFGLAKHGDSEMTVAGQVMGTPSYMPPEQAEGRQADIGPASDVYSLGATLYYLLIGRPPFQAASQTDTLRQVIQNEPVPLRRLNPDIPRDLETICMKCLRKESVSRYKTARQLAEDLGRWLDNKPIVARRVTLFERSWLWCKREPKIVGAIGAVLVVIMLSIYVAHRQNRRSIEANNRTRAQELVESLQKAEIEQVPAIVQQIDNYRDWADPLLRDKLEAAQDGTPEKLRLSLALLSVDQGQIAFLETALLNANASELSIIRDTLEPHRERITPELWKVLSSEKESEFRRFNAACVLATYDGTNKTKWKLVLTFVAERLVKSIQNSFGDAGRFQRMLKPIRLLLANPVSFIVRDTSKTDLQRDIALATVLEFAHDDPKLLAEVLAYASQRQFARTFEKLATQKTAAVKYLTVILKELWEEETPEPEKERIAQRQANAAVALLKLGEPTVVWPLLKHSPDPRARSYLIHRAAPLGVDPDLFVNRFNTETDVSIRRALLLTLGEYSEKQLSISRREPLVKKLLTVYETDPDSGLHGCTEWLLRKWKHGKEIKEITKKLQASEEQSKVRMKDSKRRWYVNTQGQTFTVLTADVFRMGSPKSEPGRDVDETLHLRKIGRRFAIAAHEVTREEFAKFHVIRRIGTDVYSKTSDSPQVTVNWYDAAAYCNWLSQKEGIPEDQWCYETNPQGKYAAGMKAKKNYLQLTGYRLPTEAEWEFACRAGAITSRYYGFAKTLMRKYAWYQDNADGHAWPVGRLKPNGFGLFDMLGNAVEWCHDGDNSYPVIDLKHRVPENVDERAVLNEGFRLLRGGSFAVQAINVRSAVRGLGRSVNGDGDFGFRPSRTYPQIAALGFPGTKEGATALLKRFLEADADHMKMTEALKPTQEDYDAYFTDPAFAAKAATAYRSLWNGQNGIKPKAGQTELLVWAATTNELNAGSGDAGRFPGGYRQIRGKLKDGVTVIRFKFVKPGMQLGLAFDGLVFVNGHWRFIPSPWRI